jgi:hypothetical protein
MSFGFTAITVRAHATAVAGIDTIGMANVVPCREWRRQGRRPDYCVRVSPIYYCDF